MKKLIKDLKLAGVPIDGVGVQAHEVVGKVPNDIRKNLEEFVALGVEVAITELDVMFYTLPPDAAGLQQQRKDFETIVGACAAVERCVGVTVWDFTDKVSPGIATVFTSHYHRSTCLKYSWIPGTFPGSGDACPWDDVSANRVMKLRNFVETTSFTEPAEEACVLRCRGWIREEALVADT